MQKIECPVLIQKRYSVDDILVATPHETINPEGETVSRAKLICNVANCAVQAFLEETITSNGRTNCFAVKDAQTCANNESPIEAEYKVSIL